MQRIKAKLNTVIVCFCFIAVIIMAILYVKVLSDDFYVTTTSYLSELSSQTASSIQNRVDDNLQKLVAIGDMISASEITTDQILPTLEAISNRNTFKRIGIIDLQGNAKTSDGHDFYAGDREYYHQALTGKTVISSMIKDVVDDKNINVYAVPIYHNAIITEVLFATNDSSNLASSLSISSFKGQGYFWICDTTGQSMIAHQENDQLNHIENITSLDFQDDFTLDALKTNKMGVTSFKENNEMYYMSYIPLEVNNWYLCSIVPKSITDSQINHFLFIAIITWIVISIVCLTLILIVYYTRKHNKEKLELLAYIDPLTKHYNFNKFISICNQKKELYALIEFDISGFRWFNEIHGKEVGDAMLCNIQCCLDQWIEEGELCTRIDGDHFAIALKTQDTAVIEKRMTSLFMMVRMRFAKQYNTSNYYFNCGVFYIKTFAITIQSGIEKAVYAKKKKSYAFQDTISFYSKDMYEEELAGMKLVDALPQSINNEEFKVYIQPKVDVKTEQVHYGEALVRWLHPVYGLLSPATFIPIFEKNGLLETLDIYIFEKVLQVLEGWNKKGLVVSISINVSRTYIFNHGYIDVIKALLKQYDVEPSQIEIEITETVALDRKEELIAIIKELKDMHIRISLDDFGSGYSSLNMLKDIPIDVIKLDQGFFRNERDTQKRSNIIISEIIKLSKRLDITTVAEGVEVKEQSDFLKEINCDYIQGYYYYKPMTVEDFEILITNQSKHP